MDERIGLTVCLAMALRCGADDFESKCSNGRVVRKALDFQDLINSLGKTAGLVDVD